MDVYSLTFKEVKIKIVFIALLSIVGCSLSVLTENAKYEKVPNTFLAQFEKNTLAVAPTQSTRNPKTGCLSLCSSTQDCHLACYNGVLCKISSALVTSYWNPVASPSQALYPLTGYTCFSSWTFDNDLTTKIVNTAVSSTHSNWYKFYATDGYYTDSYDTHFVSEIATNSWYQIDMGSAYSISKVIVKIRYNTEEPYVRFSNVEIRVGNSTSTTGNFNGNALLGYFNGTAVQGQFVNFKIANPIAGRYISFQQLMYDYLLLAELKIIGN